MGRGSYDFDPNSMTAREMDQRAKELDKTKYWKKLGYYYDPNSQTVFLTAHKRTKLESLVGLHEPATVPRRFPTDRFYQHPTGRPPVPTGSSVSSKIYLFTGDGHWVKERIDSGNFIQLEDGSLWQVNPIDRIMCSLWLRLEEIVVVESQNPSYPYFLINMGDKETVEAKLISR